MQFKLYQLEVYDTGSGFDVRKVTTPTDTRVDDLQVLSFGDLEEVIELEEGLFKIGNTAVVVTGLDREYFADAGDIAKPFVLEVHDDSGFITHGIVDPESISYNRRTERTSFTLVAWEFMLTQAGSVPARSVFETDLVGEKVRVLNDTLAILEMPPNTYAFENDVVEFESFGRTLRTFIMQDPTTNSSGNEEAYILLTEENKKNIDINTGNIELGIPERLEQHGFTIADGALSLELISKAEADTLRSIFPANDEVTFPSVVGPTGVWIDLPDAPYFNANDRRIRVHFKTAGDTVFSTEMKGIEYYYNKESGRKLEILVPNATTGDLESQEVDNWGAVRLVDGLPSSIYTDNGDGTATLDVDEIEIEDARPIDSELDSITILSRQIYGYKNLNPNSFAINESLDVATLLDSLFTLQQDSTNPFGAFSHITSTQTEGTYDEQVSLLVDFEDDPMQVVRDLQMQTKAYLRFEPGIDGGTGLPTITARIVPRKHIDTTDSTITSVPLENVIQWTENPATKRKKAIIVRSNSEYNKPDDKREYVGVWYVDAQGNDPTDLLTHEQANSTSQPDLDMTLNTLPRGDDVVEIELPMLAAYEAYLNSNSEPIIFGGSSTPKVVDQKLTAVAKYYWEFYDQLPNTMTATIAMRRPDVLAKFGSFNESSTRPLVETIFATRTTTGLKQGETRTQIEGLISPVFIEPTPLNPVAIITGQRVYTDYDGGGDERVTLSALRSHDGSEGELTYSWDVDGVTESTDGILDIVLAVGIHSVDLTVTNQHTGLTGTASVNVEVLDPGTQNPSGGPPLSDDIDTIFTIEKVQVSDGGTQYGEVRLFPKLAKADYNNLRYRSQKGGELSPIDRSTGDVTTWYGQTLQGIDSAGNPTGTLANIEYWRARVELDKDHISNIEVYVDLNASNRVFTANYAFDFDTKPEVIASLQQIGNDVYLVYQGVRADLQSIAYEKSTVDMPTSGEIDGASTTIDGNSDEGTIIHSWGAGETEMFVRVRGFNGTGGTGVESDSDVTLRLENVETSDTIAPLLEWSDNYPQQSGSSWEVSFDLNDPNGYATRFRLWYQQAGSDTNVLEIDDNTAPFDLTATVPIGEKHGTRVWWQLDWQAPSGDSSAITGAFVFDRNRFAEIERFDYRVADDGTVEVWAATDEDSHDQTGVSPPPRIRLAASTTDTSPVWNDGTSEEYSTTQLSVKWTLTSALGRGDSYYLQLETIGRDGAVDASQYLVIDREVNTDPADFPSGSIIADKLIESTRRWVQTSGEFTVTGNTVSWTNMGFEIEDGTVLGPIDDSVALTTSGSSNGPVTFFYINIQNDEIQASTTFSDAIADTNIFIATARAAPVASPQQDAFFVPGVGALGGGLKINADHISVNSITASLINVIQLNAISADMGTLTAGEIILGDDTTISGTFSGIHIDEVGFVKAYKSGTDEVTLDDDGISIRMGSGTIVTPPNAITWYDSTATFDDAVIWSVEGNIEIESAVLNVNAFTQLLEGASIGNAAAGDNYLDFFNITSTPSAGSVNSIRLYVESEVLKYKQSDNTVIALDGGTGSSVSTLNDLTDVTLGTKSDGDVLTFNSTSGQWESTAPTSSGDMLKSTYDTNTNGIVDNSETLEGYAASAFPRKAENASITGTWDFDVINLNNGVGADMNVDSGSAIRATGTSGSSFYVNGSEVYHPGNPQSITDASTLDSLDSTQFLRSDTADTFTGSQLTIDGVLAFNDEPTPSEPSSGTNNVLLWWDKDVAFEGGDDGAIGIRKYQGQGSLVHTFEGSMYVDGSLVQQVGGDEYLEIRITGDTGTEYYLRLYTPADGPGI